MTEDSTKIKKVLYVEDDPDIRELYAIKLESEFGFVVVEAIGAETAILKLKSEKDFDLVLSDFNMIGGNGNLVYLYIREHFPDIPFVFLTTEDINYHGDLKDFHQSHTLNSHLVKPLDDEQFMLVYNRIFNKAEAIPRDLDTLNYIGINIERLYKFNEINADFYIKLSDNKYVKILEKGALFDHPFLDKYKARGARLIFVTKEEYYQFTQKIASSLISRLKDLTLATDVKVKAELDVYQHIRDSLQNIGLTEQSMEMAQTAFESSLDVFSKSKDIFALLNKTISRKDYVVEHSIMASYFCYFIAKQMDWSNPKTLAKLNFAAIFHDSDLQDEKVAKIDDINGIDFNLLTSQEKKLYMEHPTRAASVVRSLPDAPENIDLIIMQHHEKPDGTGFPKKLTATTIAPLSCVFIIAHYMTNYFFVHGFSVENLEACLELLKKDYDKGNFKKPLEGLIKFFPKTTKPQE